MRSPLSTALLFGMLVLSSAVTARADDPVGPVDVNGDGVISVLGFGDSITFGIGDGTAPGVRVDEVPQLQGGYLKRVSSLGGITTQNRGVPGEQIAVGGVERFVSTVAGNPSDYVVILEGANDAREPLLTGEYRRNLQKFVNATKALGRIPILGTLQQPCCFHLSLAGSTDNYSEVVRSVAAQNDLRIADFQTAWRTTCRGEPGQCDLYNLPEGLHPNTKGYDVMGQVVLASLFGIDIFAGDGPMTLEAALGLAPGTVVVVPTEPIPAPES